MRSLSRMTLAAWLCLAATLGTFGPTYAQSDMPETESAPPDQAPPDQAPPDQGAAPAGPTLQASDSAPIVCDPAAGRLRFVEVRGTGFDAWATQHLVGNVLDGNGASRVQWGSVWVSPHGSLTLEVNLCADPFRNRPALPAGDYTVLVGQGSGQTLAATSISLSPPAEGDETSPETIVAPTVAATPTAVSTPIPYVLPNIGAQPTPTPLPPVTLPGGTSSSALNLPSPTPGPRSGLGSLAQPYPLGAPGTLADGWQVIVTGVTPDAWTGIHDAVPSTTAPASDLRDYMVRVQATFLGQGTGQFSALRLAVLSGVQTTYDQLNNACGTVPDMLPPNLVTNGGVVRGNVCFTVRATDVDSLVLFDNQATQADRVYFALK